MRSRIATAPNSVQNLPKELEDKAAIRYDKGKNRNAGKRFTVWQVKHDREGTTFSTINTSTYIVGNE